MTIQEFKDYPDTSTPINSGNLNDNFKEIKSVFNNQIAQGWYKTGINPTFTFISYNSATLTGVVSSNLNMTPYLNVGMKVKFTQNSATKYAIITAITSTHLTLFLGTDYSINSSAISNTYFSMLKAPYRFPLNEKKWSISTIISTDQVQADPVNGTWYNVGGIQLLVPIGSWKVSIGSTYVAVRNGANIQDNWAKSTLSTANNSQSDIEFTKAIYQQTPITNSITAFGSTYVEKELILTTPTTYYFNLSTIRNNNTALRINGSVSPTIIKAVCNYL